MSLRIPIYGMRDRKEVVKAQTLVDPSQTWVLPRRWFLSNGYPSTKVDGETVYLHRLLCPTLPGFVVDHISGDKLDNRSENLRTIPRGMNQQNRRGAHGRSKYRGVYYLTSGNRSKRWAAGAKLHGTHHHIGYFLTEEEAGAAAAAWRAEHMPGSREALVNH